MTRLSTVLFFIVMTFLCWGTYGPVLHDGQLAMGFSRWRPFMCVGLAYFFVAVVVPLLISRRYTEPGRWTLGGIVWSLIAGAVGALGSLGIIIAFALGGRPVYVMPLVFGCAPVINTLVTMFFSRANQRPSWIFYLGVMTVALGAAGVLVFKPQPPKMVAQVAPDVAATDKVDDTAAEADGNTIDDKDKESVSASGMGFGQRLGAILAIAITALCWGSYGPVLHKGQARMSGSRLRPFMCVGVAYFFVAILIPLIVLFRWGDAGHWSFAGSAWSLLAGGLGAAGALGIIMAFNFGGRPVYVMPLVFGGAPVINTFTSMLQSQWRTGSIGELDMRFLASLVAVIAGATTVLVFAPRPVPPPTSKGLPADASPQGPKAADDDQVSVATEVVDA